jgi:hypothetical protein
MATREMTRADADAASKPATDAAGPLCHATTPSPHQDKTSCALSQVYSLGSGSYAQLLLATEDALPTLRFTWEDRVVGWDLHILVGIKELAKARIKSQDRWILACSRKDHLSTSKCLWNITPIAAQSLRGGTSTI